jgi:hypothetical protein
MNEDWHALADVLFSERKCCRKNAKTMLEIAALRRCVIGKWNAGMSQAMLLEIFRMTKLTVVDRQHRAKTRLTQTLELPRVASGPQRPASRFGTSQNMWSMWRP